MNIKISAITDVGIERTNNEDAVIVCPDIEKQHWGILNTDNYLPLGEYGCLMVVADGMGGANAGEIASAITIGTIRDCFTKENLSGIDLTEQSVCDFLANAIHLSNNAIIEHVDSDPDSMGLGTTIVITWIIGDKAYIAWCGDSRCYRYNQTTGLKQLTKDHSYVQELVDKGEITQAQAFNHPDSNIITRCLGDVSTVSEPDFVTYSIEDGDVLLSCSDGLCGYCDNKSIEKILFKYFNNLSLCKDKLMKLALDTGGHDNITIALCATYPDKQHISSLSDIARIRRFFKKLF